MGNNPSRLSETSMTFRLTQSMKNRLISAADDERRSTSNLVNMILEQWLIKNTSGEQPKDFAEES